MRSRENDLVISGKWRKLSRYHGKTEEIKCNAWPFRASVRRRVDDILPKLTQTDQIGLVISKNIVDNMRTLFHIMHHASSAAKPTIVLSLDAMKAFECIEWSNIYQFIKLNTFGFCPNLINYIYMIYSANIITNSIISKPFELHKGLLRVPFKPYVLFYH